MAKINTAERVSAEASDNFVFQRSLLAYHAASARIAGDVLEIGTGAGYGIEAKIVGHVEDAPVNRLIIKSPYGTFEY